MDALPTRPRKHFSMIRDFHLADVFTLGTRRAASPRSSWRCAYVASRADALLLAAAFAPAAFIFDVLDGRIARWRQTSSALGRELDSLADVISFGVAPAALAFAAGLSGAGTRRLVYFVCCGVSRLARYNVTAESLSEGSGKVKYFEGTPIPTSVLLTAVLAWAAWHGRIGDASRRCVELLGADLHPLALLFALSGTLMVSKTCYSEALARRAAMFVRNCWYVIAWDHEVPQEGLFSRTVLGEAILLYRTADGGSSACATAAATVWRRSRKAGRKATVCAAATTGCCSTRPAAASRSPAPRPCRRRRACSAIRWSSRTSGCSSGWATKRAPTPALLPDNFSCDDPEWDYLPGYLHYETPQPLICDNLLDFSHLSYVHEKTLGGTTAIAQARATIEPVPRGIRVTRKVHDVPPPPYYSAVRELRRQSRPLVHLRLRPARNAADALGRAPGRGRRGRHATRGAPAQLPDRDAGDRTRDALLLPAVAPHRRRRPFDRRSAAPRAARRVRGRPGR